MNEVLTINTEAEAPAPKRISTLQIYDGNSPLLKQVIPEYTGGFPNPALEHFVEELKATRYKFGGIGLAANQCGFSMRMFVIGGLDDYDLVCINPKVLEASEEQDKGREGCLSFPGMYGNIRRPTWVRVEFLDQKGERHEITISGLTARCFLHELDHLNGISFVDKLGKLGIRLAKQRQQKLLKKLERRGPYRG